MTYTDKVAEYLRAGDMGSKSQTDCARCLCASVSVIQRRLRREGTTWRAMVEQEKRGRMLALLSRNPHADATRLAQAGGFAQRNSVGRKFHSLFGMTITDYKRACYVQD
jgi:AraC-like DNA-binding protein